MSNKHRTEKLNMVENKYLPEFKIVGLLNCRVMFVHLGCQLVLKLFCLFQIGSDFLFFPVFPVDTFSDKRINKKGIISCCFFCLNHHNKN